MSNIEVVNIHARFPRIVHTRPNLVLKADGVKQDAMRVKRGLRLVRADSPSLSVQSS